MLIETHAHLDYPDFASDFEDVLRRANEAAVTRIVTIGTSVESSRRAVDLAEKYSNIYAVIGVHPTDAGQAEEDEASIEDGSYKSRQASLFQQQLDLATELGLNVVIHQRDAWDDTFEIMAPYSGRLHGVFHCFGGTFEQANKVLDL